MIYTLAEIQDKVRPIAERYGLAAVFLFGSYARGDADEGSDIDLLVDLQGSNVSGFGVGGLYNSLDAAFNKDIDFVSLATLSSERTRRNKPRFIENILRERKQIYENHK
jgi:predicted nucleotidyltransferase